MKPKNIVILGSTGSIGINTLKIVERFPARFKVVGLTAYNNDKLLENQVKKFFPRYVAIHKEKIGAFRSQFKGLKILDVEEDLEILVALKEVDIVVIAMRGSAALAPFLSAVKSGKIVAPANKEALVIAGDIIMKEARKYKATIIPIDSEQSAIFQCLNGESRGELKKVYLTASGGVLLNVCQSRFDQLSVEEILNHPRWRMGKKITVDSATLMNKGFEVIEAMRLFQLQKDQVDVVVHPEAIIHSMVEYQDGSIIAQLGITDMRLPIQYALMYPRRISTGLKSLDFFSLKALTFQKPDLKKFPCLGLCRLVAQKDGTLPSVLNASDEEAVEAFLRREIKFTEIYKIIEKVVLKHRCIFSPALKDILEADRWAREETERLIKK